MNSQSSMSYVYILSNSRKSVVYVGCTGDLRKRIYFHKKGLIPGFTKKHNVDKLVYYEQYPDLDTALNREQQIKKYRREKKNLLVNKTNPQWLDLYETLSKTLTD